MNEVLTLEYKKAFAPQGALAKWSHAWVFIAARRRITGLMTTSKDLPASLTAVGMFENIFTFCHCIEQIGVWMQNSFLQLNSEQTEIIVCGPQQQRESVISHLETLSLKPNNQVRNLGVILDSDLNFNSHIKSISSAAFYHLKTLPESKK